MQYPVSRDGALAISSLRGLVLAGAVFILAITLYMPAGAMPPKPVLDDRGDGIVCVDQGALFDSITGLPLPLMSSGGSFMASTMTGLGIVQGVYVRRYFVRYRPVQDDS